MADSHVVEVSLRVTPTGLELFDQAGKKVGEFGRAASESATQAQGAFSKLGASVITFNQALDLVSRGADIAGAALSKLLSGIDRGAGFDDLSKRIGVSVEQLSGFDLAARAAGVPMETLALGVRTLSTSMVAAASGNDAAKATFDKLGVSVTDAAGQLKSADVVMLEVADKLSTMGAGAERTAASMEVFGSRAGATLLTFLSEGSEGLERFNQLSRDFGLVLTPESAAAMDSVGDNLTIIASAAEGVAQQFAVGLAPALSELTDEFVALVASLGIGDGSIRSFGEAVGETLSDVAGSIRGIVEEIESLGSGASLSSRLTVLFGDLAPAVQDIGFTVAHALWDGIIETGSAIWRNIDWKDVISFAIFSAIGGVRGVGLAFIGHAIMEGITGGAQERASDSAGQIVNALSAELQNQAQAQQQEASKFWEALLFAGGAVGVAALTGPAEQVGIKILKGVWDSMTGAASVGAAAAWGGVAKQIADSGFAVLTGATVLTAMAGIGSALIGGVFAGMSINALEISRTQQKLEGAIRELAEGSIERAQAVVSDLELRIEAQWDILPEGTLEEFAQVKDAVEATRRVAEGFGVSGREAAQVVADLGLSATGAAGFVNEFADSGVNATDVVAKMQQHQMSLTVETANYSEEVAQLPPVIDAAANSLAALSERLASTTATLVESANQTRLASAFYENLANTQPGTADFRDAQTDLAILRQLQSAGIEYADALAIMASRGAEYEAARRAITEAERLGAQQSRTTEQVDAAASEARIAALREGIQVKGLEIAQAQQYATLVEERKRKELSISDPTARAAELATIDAKIARLTQEGKVVADLTGGYSKSQAAAQAFNAEVLKLQTGLAVQEEYNEVLQERLAAGDDVATATREATDASKAYGQQLELEAKFGDENAATLLRIIELTRQRAAEARTASAIASVQQETAALEAQIPIMQAAIAGTISRAEAEHQIAVEIERQNLLRAQVPPDQAAVLAEQAVATREEWAKVNDEFQRIGETGVEVGALIGDAFSQTLDGIIAGTLDFGKVWESFTVSLGKQLFENLWNEKLNFDEGFKVNILDLLGWTKSTANSNGGIFDGLLGGNGSGGVGDWISGATDWAGGFFGGGGGSGSALEIIGQNADGSFIYSDGSSGWGQSIDAGGSAAGGGDFSFGGAFAGGAAGYASSSYFGKQFIKDTGLPRILKQVEDEAISSLRGINQVVGTVLGAVFGGLAGGGGMGGGIIGGIAGLFSSLVGDTWADRIDRDALRNRGFGPWGGAGPAGFGSGGFSWDLIGSTDPLANFVMTQLLGLPTLGTAFRRAGEGMIDASTVFGGEDGKGGLQALLGDFTRSGDSNRRGREIAIERGMSEAEVDAIIGGTGSIFSQLAEGELSEDAGRFAEAMGRTMAEFLSRGLAEGMDYDDMLASLRAFAHEAGIDAVSSVKNLGAQLEQSKAAAMEFGKLDPGAAAQQSFDAYAESLYGITEIFEGDFPRGVHLASIALQSMGKDGVELFGNLDNQGRETLLNLTEDAELFKQTVSKLAEQGFNIDATEFENTLADVSASATFIGENIGAAFTAPSISAGIEAMGEQLRAQITGAVASAGLGELFDSTDIAASFQPVFGVLRQLQDGGFAEQGGVTGDAFREQIVAAIVEGKANLQEYIPQLRAIRDATQEVNEAIEEALKPTDAEQFWITLEETIRANKDAIDDMAGSLFEVAANAEALAPGSGRDAAREAMDQTIDQSAFNAAKAAAGDFATKSLQGDALAQLTAQFQFKVAAAFQDGVISAEEKLDLARLKAKMDQAGQVLADSISTGTEGLSNLFRADRLKEAIEAANESLKGSLGGAAGSMFDVIKGGGSTAEGIEAFGESFRGSVRDNVLQGMQEALIQSAILEGSLGTLMGQLKQAVSVALEDGFIDADEQAFIDGLAKGIGTATDATLNALQPTLETLGGIAQTVSGNTDQAKEDVKLLNENARETDGVIDEMARRAARNLEGVGDAVSPDITGGIKAGLGALQGAVGDAAVGPAAAIKLGVGALGDALGGVAGGGAEAIRAGVGALADTFGAELGADQMRDGLAALREAFGPDAAPEEMQATLQKLAETFGASSGADAISTGLGALAGALGPDAGPDDIAAGMDRMQAALADGTIGPIEQGALALKGALGADTTSPITTGLEAMRIALGPEAQGGGIAAAADAVSLALGPGAGLAGMADALTGALGTTGAAGAADEVASALRNGLGVEVDDVALALRTQFTDGLVTAEAAARNFATLLDSIRGNPNPNPDPDLNETNSLNGVNFAANGGSFSSGSAVVGEAGEPELVVARPGGGFDVIPLDRATAAALMMGGVPGFEDGGTITGPGGGGSSGGSGPKLIGIGKRPRGWGTGGPNIDSPLDPRHPDHVDPRDKADEKDPGSLFSFSFDSAIDDFIAGGDLEKLNEALTKTAGEGVLEGLKQGMLEGLLLEDDMKKMSDFVREAMKDGLDPRELDAIEGMGKAMAAKVKNATEEMGPAFAAVSEAFGLSTEEALNEIELDPSRMAAALEGLGPSFKVVADGVAVDLETALTKAAQAAAPTVGELVGGSLSGLLSDPSKLNYDAFAQSLRGSIYEHVANGLIDAFIESAVTQGALAPMLGAISMIFDQIGQKQLTIAEANGLIAEQMAAINGVLIDPAFTSSIETLLAGIKGIGDGIGAFPPAAQAAERAATGVSEAVTEAQEDLCDGQCELTKELVDMGTGPLDEYGRAGYELTERMVPKYGAGGIVRNPTLALVGERPEAIVPLEALEGLLGAGLSPELVDALQAARGRLDASMPMGASSSLESMHAAMRDLSPALDGASAHPASIGASDSLMREVLAELRQLRASVDRVGPGTAAELGKSLEALGESIVDRPVLLDGKDIAKNAVGHLRRQSRGASSTLAGVS